MYLQLPNKPCLQHQIRKIIVLDCPLVTYEKNIKEYLWTKEMMVDEMKYFHFQTLMTLADSLEQSTKENIVAEKMRKFGMQIGKEMDILTK